MQAVVLKSCSYCDPKNPTRTAYEFVKGQEIKIPEDVPLHLAIQMDQNQDIALSDDVELRETKVDFPDETKVVNPFADSEDKE